MDSEIITPDENKTTEKIEISEFNLDDGSENGNVLDIELWVENKFENYFLWTFIS